MLGIINESSIIGGDPAGFVLKGRSVLAIEVGSVVEGVVTGITNFGAFVELPEGKTGLIHISEVADIYVNDVHDFLKERDTVRVKVLTVDDRGKIGLSIKALQDKAQAPAQPSAAPARPPRPPRDMRRTAASRQPGSPSFGAAKHPVGTPLVRGITVKWVKGTL